MSRGQPRHQGTRKKKFSVQQRQIDQQARDGSRRSGRAHRIRTEQRAADEPAP